MRLPGKPGRPPGDLLRIGLVGCGERGASYPQAIAKTGNAQLTMVADRDGELARELGERLGVPWAAGLDEMLGSSEVDAVLICTPHHVHAQQTIEAAASGKHVMVEKPLGTSLAEAVESVDAARSNGVCLSVVLQTRYQPHIKQARELVQAGAMGRLLGSSTSFQHDRLLSYWAGGYTGRSRSDWRARPETSGGGALIASAIHYLDWLTFLTGESIVEVSATHATLDSPVEVEDSITAWLRYENGALGSLNASTCVRGAQFLGQVELWGTDGQISLGTPNQFYSLRMVNGRRPGQWHRFEPASSAAGDSTEYFRGFAARALAGEEAEVSAADALRLQATVEALYRSAEQGRPATVEHVS